MEFLAGSYQVGDVLRIPNYPQAKGFRCWKVVGVNLGGDGEEGMYELYPLDVRVTENIRVPCIILESHRDIERV